MREIVFDLDGVFRDIATEALGSHPDSWHSPILDIINNNLEILITAKPTDIFKYATSNFDYIRIMSNQFKHWMPYTQAWLDLNMNGSNCFFGFWRTDSSEEKLRLLDAMDAVIVEDYPFFEDNKRVILYDMPYNKNVTNPLARFKTPDELDKIIKAVGG